MMTKGVLFGFMVDYAFKAEVLREHYQMVTLQRDWSRLMYLQQYHPEEVDTLMPEHETVRDAVSFVLDTDELLPIWREAENINLAFFARVRRLKNRIRDMLLQGTCYFVTLTFNDEALERTSPQTRRKYVTEFCKGQSDTYVANIDFGTENGREHYHAVIMAEGIDMTPWDVFGFSKAQKIGSEDDCAPLAKYISKLTNHAIKESTHGCRAIFSRS